MSQQTDIQLTTAASIIGNETAAGANTADRVRDHLVNHIDSKINNDKIETASTFDTASKTVAGRDATKTALNLKADALITPRSVTGNHTLDATDLAAIAAGKSHLIQGDDTGDLTIPPNATVAFTVGTPFLVRGFANVIAGVGVTATGDAGDLSVSLTVSLEKTATNTWLIHNGAAAGGSGTVTSFSAGDLSPLFTTSEATVTTTPALTFTQVNQNANIVFAGPTTGAAAAPTFRALVADDIANAIVIGKVITGFSSGAGAVAATDTILQAINKLDGNIAANGTSLATKWSLASGGTLTGANTITGSEANTLTFTGTWTATANNSFQANYTGAFTARATASDNLIGYKFTPTLVAAAATQVLSAVTVSPTFTAGAHSPNRRAIDVRAGWVTIGLTTHQASSRGQLDILDDGVADQHITTRNSSGTPIIRMNPSGLQMGASNMIINSQTNSSANATTGRGWMYNGDLSASSSHAHVFSVPGGGSVTDGSTAKILIRTTSTYTISTGTGSYTQWQAEPTYNITGGTQTVGGIYYNPTETSMTSTTHYGIRSSSTTALSGVATSAPTALWHMGAVTTARASMRIEAGATTTAPSSPNSGDIWHEGTGNRLMFRQGAASNELIAASAVTTEAVASDTTVTIKLNNVTYKLLARA
jgi:hypothetical protein